MYYFCNCNYCIVRVCYVRLMYVCAFMLLCLRSNCCAASAQTNKETVQVQRESVYSFRWLTLTDFGVAVVTITLCFASEPNDADRLTDQMPIPNVTRACTEF